MRLTAAAISALLVLSSALALGQEDQEAKADPLYRIEILIISQIEASDESRIESEMSAPPVPLFQITPAKPQPWVEGVIPEPLIDTEAEPADESAATVAELDNTEVTLDLDSFMPAPLSVAQGSSSQLVPEDIAEQDLDGEGEEGEPVQPLTRYSSVALFQAQPQNQLQLGDAAQNLRAKGYKTLLHQSWIQLIHAENPPLYIAAGNADDQIEGWLQLSKNRYLHLQVNILAAQAPVIEPDEGGDSQSVVSVTPSQTGEPTPAWREWLSVALQQIPAKQDRTCAVYTSPVLNFQPLTETTGALLPDDSDIHCVSYANEYFGGAAQPWVYSASRRIQSGETHYLDHPLFGLIVHIEPYSPQALGVGDAPIQ